MTLNEAIEAVRNECSDETACAYADAALEAACQYGTDGLVSQVLYVLNNTQTWRGSRARTVKERLRRYVKEHKNNRA